MIGDHDILHRTYVFDYIKQHCIDILLFNDSTSIYIIYGYELFNDVD